ncbi:MAG: MMPL family transporter [Rhodothermaceae bacterium]|nr:MMPL family transporter [Rhodothermaceae bacterium]MXZ59185.1 MMPL family transporter [Rhodothermaceae bacterium]MYB90237.1 MMPL family transporter [Rhodothermaceae bacterium]MYD68587.1 MMPL family transporter [Rhodothermaceae bacterium]MYG45719.1 MMPL family transporter [Rhodothermaceae bacterium]
MTFLFARLRGWIRTVVRYPGPVLVTALLISIGSVMLAGRLTIDPDFANLIPESYPSVASLEKIRDTIGAGEVSVDLAIESPSFTDNLAFAQALVPQVMALRDSITDEPLFLREELRRDTEFMADNGLYFATDEELSTLTTWLEDQIVEAKLAANPFFFSLDDEEEEEDTEVESLEEIFDQIVGPEYRVSADSTILVVRFFVPGSSSNVDYIEAVYGRLRSVIQQVGPSTYHTEMRTYLAGRLWRQRIEVRAITDDVVGSFGAGALAVLLVLMAYFFVKAIQLRGRKAVWSELARAPVTALLIGIPLLMSLAWTAAIGFLAYETLNLFSSTLGLVLFGLGIDYGIHFYARYIEERGAGHSVEVAAENTFMSTGQAIAVGAFTTAAAMYVLVAADFKGFSEFGFLAGTGVLVALISTLHVLPALLVLCERWRILHFERSRPIKTVVRGPLVGARGLLAGCALVTVIALFMAPRVEFEYRFSVLEPEYEDWIAVNSKVAAAYSDFNRRNPAYIVVDHPAEAPAVAEALRRRIERDTVLHVIDTDSFRTTIRGVETLQDRFPLEPEKQTARIAQIAYIRDSLLTDPVLAGDADLERIRRAAQTRTPLAVEDVPELLSQRFMSKTGELGGYITILPGVGLSDGRKSMAFAEDVANVTTADGKTYHAGSPSIVAADVLRLMRQESPYMILATLIIVTLLMWVNFGRFRWALLAMLPLVVGVIWMILFMQLFGMRLNFYNLFVIPAIIGIGNDAGAHLVHRYREEGAGTLWRILRSTGEHVTMGAVTTMVGFGGLLLSFHPGLNTIGSLAITGIGSTLLAALLFLPALIQVQEDHRPSS